MSNKNTSRRRALAHSAVSYVLQIETPFPAKTSVPCQQKTINQKNQVYKDELNQLKLELKHRSYQEPFSLS
jgi:hypothetical protein